MGTGRSARVLRLLEQSATEQSRRRARGGRSSEQGWWTSWCSRWPSVYSGTRENGQVVRQREGMMELRDESLRWSHRSRFIVGHDECRDQCGREQRAASTCTVECRLDHVVHKEGSGLCCACNVQRVNERMEKVLSCVFPVEGCKTWCVDARSVGNFAGHERYGGQSGCWMHQNDENFGRNRDSEFVCWYYERRQ